MKKIFLLSFILLVVTCCSNQNEPTPVPADAKPIPLSVGLEKKVGQDNEFAFHLLNQVIANSGETNVFISPLSVSIAFGMAWNGANGETKTEIETALNMSGMSVSDINDYYKIMQTTLPTLDPTTRLSIANALWYRTGFPVKQDFLKVNSDYFNAYIKGLDFSQSWAVDTINNWCSKKTNKLIPTIINQIPSDEVMILMNAIYFKGIWRKQFDKKYTTELPFTGETGVSSTVNMMAQKDTFAYVQTDNAQYLDMPYGNKAFSMTVILPLEGKRTSDVLSKLTSGNWTNTLNSMSKKEVQVFMPRFKQQNHFKLNQELQDMGIKLAFTENADFSNISTIQLLISEVVHDTYVTVDEQGTEAAAVTSIGMTLTVIPEPIVFNVNKPFIFVIREKSTGVILFIGKMGAVDKY